jgi:Putative peptidoglycan binding domain
MSYPFAPWEGAKNCIGSVSSGAAALLAWCQANHQPPGRSLGIYNCRNVRGSTRTSLHGEGRALDWGMPLGPDRRGTPLGHELVDLLGSNADKIGLQCIIYDRTIWSAGSPDGRPYGGVAPHYDHLHIELSWEAARELTLATLVSVLGGTAERPLAVDAALAFNQGQGFSADEIKLIQRVVTAPVTGDWDADTVLAVADWQRDNGIPVDGKVWRSAQGNTWPLIQAATDLSGPLERG